MSSQCSSVDDDGLFFTTDAAVLVNVTSVRGAPRDDSPVTLVCVVRANPANVTDLVTWYRVADPDVELAGATADVVATTVTSRLSIARASSRRVGLYRCVAFNGLGLPVSATINITVPPLRAYLNNNSNN